MRPYELYHPATKNNQSNGESGFTILELTIVIALLAFMALMIAGSLRSGAIVWNRARSYSNQMEETQAARDFLRQLLRSIYPKESLTENADWEVAFSGTANSIEFLSPAPGVTGEVGYLRVAITVLQENETKGMELLWRAEKDKTSKSRKIAVLRNLASGTFSYFGAYDGAEDEAWRDDWVHQKKLPALIAVRAQSAGRKEPTIDLVVSPRVEVSAACEFDFRSHTCRFE